MIDIFIPSLRPERIDQIVANITKVTPTPHRIYFILEEPDYTNKVTSVPQGCTVLLNHHSPSYAGAINSAFEQTAGEYFFCGADDLLFHDNWWVEPLKLMSSFDVVGTNDLFNPNVKDGRTATHFLVKRSYIDTYTGTMDKSFKVLFEYKHNYCDTEFIDTARKRGVFSPCLDSIVEHCHWGNGKNPKDSVYEKGNQTASEDHQMYQKREQLWL